MVSPQANCWSSEPRGTHAQAADVLAQLANPQAKPAGSLAALHRKTSQRAAKRGELPEKLPPAQPAEGYGRSPRRVRAGICWPRRWTGQLELESLTELQIAWKSDATKKMFEGKAPVIALRSAWAITAASRALPDEKELAALADSVRKRCRPAAEEAMASLKDNPEDISAILVAVYAAMAVNEAALSAQVLDALPDEPPRRLADGRRDTGRPRAIEQARPDQPRAGRGADHDKWRCRRRRYGAGRPGMPASRRRDVVRFSEPKCGALLGEQPLPGSVCRPGQPAVQQPAAGDESVMSRRTCCGCKARPRRRSSLTCVARPHARWRTPAPRTNSPPSG